MRAKSVGGSNDDATAGLSLNGTTDDAPADDGGATDDAFSTKVTVGGNTFGALADAVAAEVSAQLHCIVP